MLRRGGHYRAPAGSGGQDVGGVAAWSREAEASGVDGVFVGDHVTFYGSGSDGLIRLAMIAAATAKKPAARAFFTLRILPG